MICLDTTFLIDLWRNARDPDHPCLRYLREQPGQTCAVAAHAAGEFLAGSAAISPKRFADSLHFLNRFAIGVVDLETAQQYASIVAALRSASKLTGVSKPDLWIAAWAVQHGAVLATRNLRHFEAVPGLRVESYTE